MASEQVRRQAEKIMESCGKLQNMHTDEDIRSEVTKIQQYCREIESKI